MLHRYFANNAIKTIAKKNQVCAKEVRKHIAEAIDETWALDDLKTRDFRNMLFPKGRPSVEEFITTLAKYGNRWNNG